MTLKQVNAKINIVTKNSVTSSIKYGNADISRLILAFAWYFSVTTKYYFFWEVIRIGFMLLTNCVYGEGEGT